MERRKNKAKSNEALASIFLTPPQSPSERGSSKSPVANSCKNRKWFGINIDRCSSNAPVKADDTNKDPLQIPPPLLFPPAMPGLEE
eukprot:7371097-Ditylum_brightwellii.AAC.1